MNKIGIHQRLYIITGLMAAAVLGLTCLFASGVAVGAVILVLLAYGAAFYLTVRGERRFLKAVEGAMLDISGGNTECVIPYSDRTDDIGTLARGLGALRDSFHMAKALDEQRVGERGGLEIRKTKLEEEIRQFKTLSDRSYGLVVGAAGELEATFDDMSKIVTDVQVKTDSAAQLSENTASNVNQVAVASEELSASSKEIAQLVTQSSQNAKDAMEKILIGEQSAEKLSKAATEIGNVVRVISEIASQTNLLALNATIEAARAGGAGKGFAVVASEVKSLSQGTATATDTIGEQIQGIQGIAKQMVDIIKLLKQTIVSSTEYATSISAAIEEQYTITREIAHNMQVASTNVGDISSNIAVVKSIAQKVGTSTQDVQQASDMLAKQAESLNTGIQSFLTKIQAE